MMPPDPRWAVRSVKACFDGGLKIEEGWFNVRDSIEGTNRGTFDGRTVAILIQWCFHIDVHQPNALEQGTP